MVRERVIVIALVACLPLSVLSALAGHYWPGSKRYLSSSIWKSHPILRGSTAADLRRDRRVRVFAWSAAGYSSTTDSRGGRTHSTLRCGRPIGCAFGARGGASDHGGVYGIGVLIVGVITPRSMRRAGTRCRPLPARTSARGYVVRLRKPAGVQLCCSLVFPIVRLDTVSLAGVVHQSLDRFPRTRIASAGSGFLSSTVYAFAVLLVAHGAMVAGAGRQPHLLPRRLARGYKVETAAMVAFCCAWSLAAARVRAEACRARSVWAFARRDAGGALCARVRRQVVAGGVPPGEPLVGTADIQSLVDGATASRWCGACGSHW